MEPPAFLWFHWKFQFMEYLFFLLVPDKPADKQHVSRGRFLLDFFGGLGYYMKWKISACPFRRSGGIALIWHSSTAAQVAAELQTDPAGGLTADQAEERLKQYGKNQLTEKKPRSLFLQFLDQIKDFMVVILIIAAVVSGITTWLQGENNWLEPIVIIAIVLLNALIGVVQENRAQKALSALKNMAAPHAKVLRKVGVDRVIYPERDMAIRLANRLENSKVLDFIQLSEQINISKLQVPHNFIGKSIEESGIRPKFGLNVIAIENSGQVEEIIKPSYVFRDGDVLIVSGNKENVLRLAGEE